VQTELLEFMGTWASRFHLQLASLCPQCPS